MNPVGPLTWITVALLGVALWCLVGFGIADGIAHLTHYRYGETFSALTWWLEERHPLLKGAVAAACLAGAAGFVALFCHLVLRLF